MKITEAQLRNAIRQIIKEESGPAILKQASTAVIQAINDENSIAFWGAINAALEGIVASTEHAPGNVPQRAQDFKQQAHQLLSTVGGIIAASKAAVQKNKEQPERDAAKKIGNFSGKAVA
jgi:hypothetical protein